MINLLVPHIKSISISPHVSYSLYPTAYCGTLYSHIQSISPHVSYSLYPTVEYSTHIYSQYHHTYHTLCILLWNTLLTYTVNITTRIILSVSYSLLWNTLLTYTVNITTRIILSVSYSLLWNTLLTYTVNITTRIILSVSNCGILYSHIQSISPHVSYSLYPTVEYSTHIYSQYHHTYHTLCILLWNTLLTYTVNITTRIILSVSYCGILYSHIQSISPHVSYSLYPTAYCGILYSHIQSISPHVSYSLYPTVEYFTLIYSQYHHTYHTLCILLWNTLLSYTVNITTRIILSVSYCGILYSHIKSISPHVSYSLYTTAYCGILYSHIQSISPHVSYSLYPTVEYSTHIYSQYHHTYHTLYPTVEYSTHIYSQYHHTYHTLCILLWNTLLTYTVNITTRIILSVSYCGILYSHIQSISPHVSYSLYPTVEYSTLIYSQYHHTYHTLLIYTVNITTRTYHTLYTTAYCGIYSHCVFYQQK
ncbi:dynein heavy chain-like isoform X3 [Pecten maximus]|uniref:dynein heavy chain-like isoform X3 n=1 Tax=Pecten maximus TaxID=6579 RepID=UPI0014586C92|nr:dynein heavy chain-like isoform X3 [Pecten maximus]